MIVALPGLFYYLLCIGLYQVARGYRATTQSAILLVPVGYKQFCHRIPVCGFLVFWRQIATELFALFHHNGVIICIKTDLSPPSTPTLPNPQ